MNIEELANKYDLEESDFWELRKNSGTWIITHNACEKIAHKENIIFEPVEVVSYVPTIITENGEKVQKVRYGKENWMPAWAGTCQKKTGDVALLITGYKADNPDYKIQSNGEANVTNCTSNYYFSMALKRAQDRVILQLINAYEYGIYSDVEADDFKKKDDKPTQKQFDLLDRLTYTLGLKKTPRKESFTKKDISDLIKEYEDEVLTRESEEHERNQKELIGE
tara:strand:+ start:1933 stop:2601 length:669 start_codon:yes stop_codon:yes gene_type:complete